MVRIQIHLHEDQLRRCRQIAARDGVSLAAVIRRAVDALIARDQPLKTRYARAAGFVGSVRGDIAEELAESHDRHLDEAFEEASLP